MDANQTEGLSVGSAGPAGAGTLEYRPARRRRRRWWLWLLAAAVVALAAVGYRHRQPFQAKWAQLAFERRCLNYREPADLIVFTDDPRDFAALLNAAPRPVGGRYRQSYDVKFVSFDPDVWTRHPLLKWDPGPAFLHRLKNPRGETRLVGIDLSPLDDDLWFYPRVVIPAGLSTDARPARTRKEYSLLPLDRQLHVALGLEKSSSTDAIRVYCGQPDPDDPTHFTIALEVNGAREVLDGWLQDDETVLLKPRDRETYLREPGMRVWTAGSVTTLPSPDGQ